jgi:GntR family transcriptional regulator, rspAB operon transcriptional repressor
LVKDLSFRAERIRMHFDVRRGHALDDHARILEACGRGDVEEAIAATRDHILGAHLMMMPAGDEVPRNSTLEAALAGSGWPRPAPQPVASGTP